MASRSRFFNSISILVVLVLPTLILLGYAIILLVSYLSELLISVNEWWLYLTIIFLSICILPLPPFTKKCASSFYKFYIAFVRRLFSKAPQSFVIQDKVDLNSCDETTFDDPTSNLPILPPPTHCNNESTSRRCESLPSTCSSVPPDLGPLIPTSKSESFFFRSFLAGCLFFFDRVLVSSFVMLSRIGGEIVHSCKFKIINFWAFR
jgi:hypothetical protein